MSHRYLEVMPASTAQPPNVACLVSHSAVRPNAHPLAEDYQRGQNTKHVSSDIIARGLNESETMNEHVPEKRAAAGGASSSRHPCSSAPPAPARTRSLALALPAAATALVPPAEGIKRDRPRLLLRPAETRYAISLQQLKALPRDGDFQQMLQRLEGLKPPKAAALALVYQLTGRAEVAERALQVFRSWKMPDDPKAINDPFFVYFTLSDMALAYDWLHAYAGFDDRAKAALRQKLQPLAENALKVGNDTCSITTPGCSTAGPCSGRWPRSERTPPPSASTPPFASDSTGSCFAPWSISRLQWRCGGYWWRYCQHNSLMVRWRRRARLKPTWRGNPPRAGRLARPRDR